MYCACTTLLSSTICKGTVRSYLQIRPSMHQSYANDMSISKHSSVRLIDQSDSKLVLPSSCPYVLIGSSDSAPGRIWRYERTVPLHIVEESSVVHAQYITSQLERLKCLLFMRFAFQNRHITAFGLLYIGRFHTRGDVSLGPRDSLPFHVG